MADSTVPRYRQPPSSCNRRESHDCILYKRPIKMSDAAKSGIVSFENNFFMHRNAMAEQYCPGFRLTHSSILSLGYFPRLRLLSFSSFSSLMKYYLSVASQRGQQQQQWCCVREVVGVDAGTYEMLESSIQHLKNS